MSGLWPEPFNTSDGELEGKADQERVYATEGIPLVMPFPVRYSVQWKTFSEP